MAEIGNTYPTLADVYKRTDPDDKIAEIIEMLSEDNLILEDAITVEGNLPTGHRTTVRTGLPSPTWRKLNYGVQPTKSQTKQVDDQCGMLEDYAEVDKRIADLNGNTAAFRLSEDSAHIEGMAQEMADTLFYGNTDTDPEKFLGLSERFGTISTDPTKSGYNIVDAGGTGSDNMSIWFLGWSDKTVHLTYPKGSKAGLTMDNLGEVTLEDAAGGKYQGYRTHYAWDLGLVVRDWRYVARLCNIDVSNIKAGTYTTLIEDMITAYYKVKKWSNVRGAIYCNKTAHEWLHKLSRTDTNVQLTFDMVEGKPKGTFLGLPLRQCDALLETEAQVT